MAISFDNASSTNFAASSVLFSHTVNTGANPCLFVTFATHSNASSGTAVTYAGNNLTFLRKDVSATVLSVETWYLVNPPTGANNVSITLSVSSKSVAGATSYFGVNQTTPVGTPVGENGTDATAAGAVNLDIVTTRSNSLLYDAWALRTDAGTMTAGLNQTQRWRNNTTGGAEASNTATAVSTKPTTNVGTYTMSGTTATANNYAYHTFEMIPIAGKNQAFIF